MARIGPRAKRGVAIGLGALVLGGVGIGLSGPIGDLLQPAPERPSPTLAMVEDARPKSESRGFARATEPRELTFPQDHGPHPAYRSEWWYLVGNLATSEGRPFGYQLTLFRQGLVPSSGESPERRASEWATDQVYMGHFAISDIAEGRFRNTERFARGAAGIAGARSDPPRAWLADWSIRWQENGDLRSQARHDGMAIDLALTPEKPIILQGEDGLSSKGPEAGNASYYYSYPRLATQGTVRVDGTAFEVTGTSWLDREFGSSFLSKNQVGWDWFALQLENGTELMIYRLRRSDGTKSPYSSGTFVRRDGSTRHLEADAFELTPRDRWQSPRSETTYPIAWRIRVPELELDLTVTPAMRDQELAASFVYYEGAVRVTGRAGGREVTGVGYQELTGYARSLQGRF